MDKVYFAKPLFNNFIWDKKEINFRNDKREKKVFQITKPKKIEKQEEIIYI